MNLDIRELKFGERPDVTRPDELILKYLKEEGIRKLVDDHYNLLRKSEYQELFPVGDEDFEKAKLRSSDFFIQVLGGPDYFNQNRGQPLLVRRHRPFRISPGARIVWLECYQKLIPDLKIPEYLKQQYWDYLNIFSCWMVNTPQD